MAPASLALFAQNNPNAGGGGAALGGLACIFAFVFLFVGVFLIIRVFYLLACSRCFQQIAPHRRGMQPGLVWLCLIPLFGTVWEVVMMFKLAESLRAEYRARRMRGDDDFGQTAAIIFIIGFAVPIASLVGFIMHWVKVVGYTNELLSRPAYDDEGYDDNYDDDDDYDRPRRARSRDRGDDDRKPWDRD